jgi:hypothetical protein
MLLENDWAWLVIPQRGEQENQHHQEPYGPGGDCQPSQ